MRRAEMDDRNLNNFPPPNGFNGVPPPQTHADNYIDYAPYTQNPENGYYAAGAYQQRNMYARSSNSASNSGYNNYYQAQGPPSGLSMPHNTPSSMNPNAPVFQPGNWYQPVHQAPQHHNTQMGGYSNSATTGNGPARGSRGFSFNPFGYGNGNHSNPPHAASVAASTNTAPAQKSYSTVAAAHSYSQSPSMIVQSQPPLSVVDSAGMDFAAGAESAPPPFNPSEYLLQKMQSSQSGAALFEVQIGLEQLAQEGHEFETWATAIRDRLTSADFRKDDLPLAASILIEMAVVLPNCQYNFSKLCHFLTQNIQEFETTCLMPELSEFIYGSAQFLNPEQLKNLLLLLAELYDKIETNGVRSYQLSTLILEQINQVFKQDTPIDDRMLKAMVQTLKLTGRFLENDQGPEELNDVFTKLNEVCCTSKVLSESAKAQVLALRQLRENQWGVTTLDKGPSAAGSSSVMIYGPDGTPLTEEECAFLDENDAENFPGSPSGSWSKTLEEDDVLEDYEKFLQATAVRAAEKALEKLSFDDDEDESGSGSPKPNPPATADRPSAATPATKEE